LLAVGLASFARGAGRFAPKIDSSARSADVGEPSSLRRFNAPDTPSLAVDPRGRDEKGWTGSMTMDSTVRGFASTVPAPNNSDGRSVRRAVDPSTKTSN